MSETFDYDVFVSHNRADKPRVRKLAERLRSAGLRIWFDEWIIQPGDDIYLAIEHGLEASRTLVLCLSPAALGSDWVSLERSTALFRDPSNAGRRFIPLLLDDCKLPDTLRRFKYVDYRDETPPAFAQLLDICLPQEQGEAIPVVSETPPKVTRMAEKVEGQWNHSDEEVQKNLPPGVKLVRTLRGHTNSIGHIAVKMVDQILILHLSDLHFGPNSRFCDSDPNELGKNFYQALETERVKRGIDTRISLVIVTGDITERARSEEYDKANVFFASGL